MRTVAVAVCLLALSARAQAQTAPAPTAAERYEAQKKSPALAVTLEALSPIAGIGAFYAHDTDKGWFLAVASTVAAGAGVGAAFWLVHLSHQQESGFNRTVQDTEQAAAISVLATAAVVYLVARISGLALASEATEAFNENLGNGLGVPSEPVVPFHALAPGPMLRLRF
ncbi:MAG TPA: hypothetical protein VI456_06640 [Polyangia bacterium]